MDDRPWWSVALQWGLWALIMSVVMGWLARSRTAARGARAGALVQPRSVLIVGLVTAIFFLALAVLSVVFAGEGQSPFVSASFAAFAVLGLCLIADYYNGRHELTPDGLRYGKTFGAGGVARWDQVRRLRYSNAAKWFRLDLADGRTIRVSAMLMGLPEFAERALRDVPATAIDEDARRILEATAGGEPPRIWV